MRIEALLLFNVLVAMHVEAYELLWEREPSERKGGARCIGQDCRAAVIVGPTLRSTGQAGTCLHLGGHRRWPPCSFAPVSTKPF